MKTGTIASPRHWRTDDVLVRFDNEHKVIANEILHTCLTSEGIITWNLRGEIVHHGRNIFGQTLHADLLQYVMLPYDAHYSEDSQD